MACFYEFFFFSPSFIPFSLSTHRQCAQLKLYTALHNTSAKKKYCFSIGRVNHGLLARTERLPRNALYNWKGNSRYFCLFHSEQTRTFHKNKPPALQFWQCSDDPAQVSNNVSISIFTIARHMLIISLEGNGYDIKVFLWMWDCVCDQVIWSYFHSDRNFLETLFPCCFLFLQCTDQPTWNNVKMKMSNFQVVTIFKLVSFACVMCMWNSPSNICTKLSEKFMFQGGLHLNKFTCIFQTAYVPSVSKIQTFVVSFHNDQFSSVLRGEKSQVKTVAKLSTIHCSKCRSLTITLTLGSCNFP